jgi:hypothetical protein
MPKVDAGPDEVDERAEPNKLMAFLKQMGERTKSMLLATATPVQLHPVEAWDLLDILSHGNDGVLGGWTRTSPWFRSSHCLAVANGDAIVPTEVVAGWQYVRDPLPARAEGAAFDRIRRNLDAEDRAWQFAPEVLDKLTPAIKRVQLQNGGCPLWRAVQPAAALHRAARAATWKPRSTPRPAATFCPRYGAPVRRGHRQRAGPGATARRLRGGRELQPPAAAACERRFKTLLLRRLGSSMEAGRNTVMRLLGAAPEELTDEDDDDSDDTNGAGDGDGDDHLGHRAIAASDFKDFTKAEVASLNRCLALLRQGGNNDPKLEPYGYLLGTGPM